MFYYQHVQIIRNEAGFTDSLMYWLVPSMSTPESDLPMIVTTASTFVMTIGLSGKYRMHAS